MSGKTAQGLSLEGIYRAHYAFVWRSLLHMGLIGSTVDDALQDVFLVVHRRLQDFEGPCMRSWLYGIARRVASDYRRGAKRAVTRVSTMADPDVHPSPHGVGTRVAAASMVQQFLAELDDDKREVFVLTEVEGMTAREIADMLGINANTVSARLRAARLKFARVVSREAAREAGKRRRA